ncbi:cobyrinate a,c-diamide synthase [Oculatella sp. LEGE 06141]|uniref:cobyrinate a,c-diamide synthase n=1 Tax=Oculatella sp. LEGE 06141 TaxID=1828648 RepID=UPI0018818FF5|nr:cobyrinate a,c-diamide synthase [Oculatella sp. LEGE 06141]MBE9179025.1 cobyrinate a,c-diamide synthase [Oculatella sp. LEGE 06141]
MSLIIAGERSGVGKTTVTLSLLAALHAQQQRVQSFKVGPDYIDPMFHQHITGRSCRNLDPVLTSEAYVQQCFWQHTQAVDCALIEGVMGLFDGATGANDWASTAHIARLLDLPILLVLDCSRLSRSVAAIAHGYRSFDPRLKLAGVVLNRVGSDRHLELLTAALAPLAIPVLGVLRRQDRLTIPDRHLGLVPTAELKTLNDVVAQLTQVGETCFDWSQLRPLLQVERRSPPETDTNLVPSLPAHLAGSVRLAVARDRAFNFYYADNLEQLEQLGAEVVDWSPLADAALPENIGGLYLGGGFPEVFAEALAANESARNSVQAAIQAGMPTYAECGGLMYLSQQLVDFDNHSWDMVGVLPTVAQMGQRLTLGYRRAVALQDSPLMPAGTAVWGHEFHRSTLQDAPSLPLYTLQGYDSQQPTAAEGWRSHQIHASYVHLHWGSRPDIPARFLAHCAQFVR